MSKLSSILAIVEEVTFAAVADLLSGYLASSGPLSASRPEEFSSGQKLSADELCEFKIVHE